MKFSLQKIYPITDRKLSGLSHAKQVAEFIEGGATLIQIRDKSSQSAELFADATAAVKLAHGRDVRVLINDRVDIALLTGADGVHLGQDDLPAEQARRILGTNAVIGLSTHSIDQVRDAVTDGIVDYIAFGPIFPTSTKVDHDPLVGLDALAEARQLVSNIPLVAIGGISIKNLVSVLMAGADSGAMISEFYKARIGIPTRFRTLLKAARSNNNVVIS